MDTTTALLESLDARITALEQDRSAETLDLATTCKRLGIARSTFYDLETDLKRLGLVELPSLVKRRRFDAASVERVRLGRRRTRAA